MNSLRQHPSLRAEQRARHFARLGVKLTPILAAALAFRTDGEPLPDAEFQAKVLGGMEATQTKIKTLEDKHAEILKAMPSDLKATVEEMTKVKKTINDQQANMEAFSRTIAKFDAQLSRHARRDFGDPVARISGDKEMKARFNASIRHAISRGGDHFERAALDIVQKAGLGEDTSPGSNLIDDALSAEIYDLIASYGIWNTVQVVPASTKDNKFPVDTADPVAQFILTEASAIDDDANITGTSVTATAEVCAVLLNVSLQLIEDAEYDLTGWIANKFARAYAKRLDYATFRGDGTADANNGGMTGVFNAGTAATAAAGNVTVEGTDLEDWMNCLLVTEALFERPSKWWMHPFILARAALVRDGNGRPIFQTALEAPSTSIGSILGRPVITGNVLPSTNTASSKVAAYGDPGGQINGIRKGYMFEASDHHKWNTLQRSFRAHGRFATKNRAATAFTVLTLPAS